MTKIILLPGASASNSEWLDSWSAYLTKENFEIRGIRYDHWDRGGDFNFKNEISKISALPTDWQNAIVLCKSIGTFLMILCTHEKVFFPTNAIFMGFPSNLDGTKDETVSIDLNTWLSDYNVPTHIFQNEHDPVTSFEQVKSFLHTRKNFMLHKFSGNTHLYTIDKYADEVSKILKSYLSTSEAN